MSTLKPPVVKQQMLFRVAASTAFEAFVNPEITTRFWFTHSDGRLETGKNVRWEWRMYGCAAQVHVLNIEPNRRIEIEWGDEGKRTHVTWTFHARPDGTTLVEVKNSGFTGEANDVVTEALNSMGGFSFLLASAKAFLEHKIELNLVSDHAPDAHVEHIDRLQVCETLALPNGS